MRSFVLSDNRDTYVGFQLAGIEGVYLQEPSQYEKSFDEAVSKEYGIVFITEKIFNKIPEKVMKQKERKSLPLVTVIPDRYGYGEYKGKMSEYIKDSVGL
ncbi:MAG TPA: ATPase [Eubacteriaceae bacterium]|nr:ATPase [Eubacteriaceae bacterium]